MAEVDGSRASSRPATPQVGAARRFRARAVLAVALTLMLLGPILTSHFVQGLTAHYYDNPTWSGSPLMTVRDRALSLRRAHDAWYPTRYSIEWTGVIHVPTSGYYGFSLTSDDGSSLWIGDVLVVDNGGAHPSTKVDGAILLGRGFHPIRVRYMQQEADAVFAATWYRQHPGTLQHRDEQPLSSATLFPRQPGPISLALVRVGRGLVSVGRAASVFLLGLVLVAGSFWLFVSRRAFRDFLASRGGVIRGALEGLATCLVDLGLIVTALVVFWVTLFGRLWVSLGAIDLRVHTVWAPLIGLVAALTMRRWLRGSAFGGVRPPRFVTVQVREYTTRLVSAVAASSLVAARRTRVVMLAVLVGSAVGVAGLTIVGQQGLTGRYYREAQWSGDLFATTRDADVTLRRAIYDFMDDDYHYSIEWAGVIYVPTPGEYEFALTSRGRSGLWIGGLVVDGLSAHDLQTDRGRVRLTPGFYPIHVRYAPSEVRRSVFRAEWRHLSMGKAPIPEYRPLSSAVLFPEQPGRIAFMLWRLHQHLLRAMQLLLLLGLVAAYLIGCHWLLIRLETRVEEHHVYLVLLIFLAAMYYLAPFSDVVGDYEGYMALRPLGRGRTIASFLLIVFVTMAYRRHQPRVDAAVVRMQTGMCVRPVVVLAVALVAVLVFFGLRNGFVNSDGTMFRWVVPLSVTEGRAGVNFDEMWESYLHGQFWYVTNAAFGWSVRLSYQVASSLAGGLFLWLLWSYARFLLPNAALAFCVLMVCGGGYMQLFFGEVENYTWVTVAIVAYYLVSARFLRGLHRLLIPSAMLSLAMTFHLLAGFLLPSLLFLFLVELRRRAYLQVALGVVAFVSVFMVTMFVLGKPLDPLHQASWGVGALGDLVTTARGSSDQRWAWFAFDAYHWDQYSLLALMFPANVLIVPLLLGGRIKMNPVNLHLIAAWLGLAFFQFTYRALLPLSHDWNLYATAAIPLAILVWRNLLQADDLRYRAELTLAWGLLSFIHSYSWIVANHQYAP